MHNDRILEEAIVLLRPILLVVDGEDILGTMGAAAWRGHVGA